MNTNAVSDDKVEETGEAAPLLGIVVKMYGSSYYGRMLDAAVEQLQSSGFEVIVQASDLAHVSELDVCESLIQRGCSGVIIHSDELSDEQLSRLFQEHSAIVLMNRLVPGFEPRCVYVDNEAGGRRAAQYLISHGHKNIAMITGKQHFPDTIARTAGFTTVLRQHALELPPELVIEGYFQQKGGSDGLESLLRAGKHFTAVFVHNDEMAVGLIQACQAHGIDVPQEISVIGFDDHESAAVVTPGLTTIRQPKRDIGNRVARIMRQLVSGHDTSEPLQADYGSIDPQLIERDSVINLDASLKPDQDKKALLTEREKQCLQWTAAGKTSSEIAVILSMAESTVNFHMKNVFHKLNASNRVHAVALALSMSLIDPV